MQRAIGHCVKERFFSETIARREQLLAPAVVYGEGKHALQALDARRAKFFVRVKNDLRVGDGSKAVSLRFEQWAQRTMVVDLSVENDPARTVLVRHRLVAARAIDDREAPMPQRNACIVEEPVAVG